MYTPFYIGINLQYGPYAHFGYWYLVSDPEPNIVVQKVEKTEILSILHELVNYQNSNVDSAACHLEPKMLLFSLLTKVLSLHISAFW